jgi:hypothetical protein
VAYLTAAAAAAAFRLGVQPATIRRWVREGVLPASRTPCRDGRGQLRIAEFDLVLALQPARLGDSRSPARSRRGHAPGDMPETGGAS